MTADDFRQIALSFDGVVESAHMHHPDFRVAGAIFATLGYPDASCGMVKLPSEEQRRLVETLPGVFTPANGAWGQNGSTLVRLAAVKTDVLRHVLEMAWQQAQAKTKRTAG